MSLVWYWLNYNIMHHLNDTVYFYVKTPVMDTIIFMETTFIFQTHVTSEPWGQGLNTCAFFLNAVNIRVRIALPPHRTHRRTAIRKAGDNEPFIEDSGRINNCLSPEMVITHMLTRCNCVSMRLLLQPDNVVFCDRHL